MAVPEYRVAIPGEVTAPAFGLRLRIEVIAPAEVTEGQTATSAQLEAGRPRQVAPLLRPRKVKEILERLRVTGSSRALWPVVRTQWANRLDEGSGIGAGRRELPLCRAVWMATAATFRHERGFGWGRDG